MPLTMDASHIAVAEGGFEPQRRNNWLLEIPLGAQDQDLVRLSLARFPFPREHSAVTIVDYLNEQRKVAGKSTYDTFPLVTRDYVDQGTYLALFAWRREVYNPESGKIGLAANYKKNGTLILFGPDGSNPRNRKWMFHGLWPSDVEGSELDMSSGEQVEVTVTLQVDFIDTVPSVASTLAR